MATPEQTVENHLKMHEFCEQLEHVSETTKNDYLQKLNAMKNHIHFLGDEQALIEYCNQMTNPNTKANKLNALQRMRHHFEMDTKGLQDALEYNKGDIRLHRKIKAKINHDALMTYDELLKRLDQQHGAYYFLNHMYVHHALRNQDVNVLYKSRVDKDWVPTENTLIFNPKAKRPKMTMHVVHYKTASTYGPKVLELDDKRLWEELNSIGLKHNQYVFQTREGRKPTLNNMNVKSAAYSIDGMGEGRIAKILIKHLIDTGNHNRVAEISKSRGTALQTLYTHYNTYDHSI